jgi:predicted dienelactone hydrolase
MKPNKFSFCLQCVLSLVVSLSTPACSEVFVDSSERVAIKTYEWKDAARVRDVPVKIYYPETGKGPFPVIVFSHGLGGSRDGYEYLGRYWAGHGYVSVHLQHLGSDTGAWKGKLRPMAEMKKAAADPRNAFDRVLDVRFAIDQLERLNRDDKQFTGRLDLAHLGMAGHSFGAWTTLAVVGQRSAGSLGNKTSFLDPRIKAAIPMSAPVQRQRGSI